VVVAARNNEYFLNWHPSGVHLLFCSKQAFIGLTICAKMIAGGPPLVPEILDHTDRTKVKSAIFDLFLLVATEP